MKYLLLVLALFTGSFYSALSAQTQQDAQKNSPIGYFTFGGDLILTDFAPFSSNGAVPLYPTLNDGLFNLVFQLGWRTGRWDGGFGSFGGQNEFASGVNGFASRYRHGGISFNNSFNLIRDNGNGWFVGPEASAIFQWANVTLSNTDRANNVADLPFVEYAKLTQFSVPLELGGKLEKFFYRKRYPDSFWVVGIRAGYRLANEEDWEIDEAVPIADFPIHASGVYFSLRVGRSLK